MEWFSWICILLQGIWCFYMGYRAGRDDNDDLSEEAQIELKKYYWDHVQNGGTEEQIKTLLADNKRLQESYNAMYKDLQYMTQELKKARNLYVDMADEYCTKVKQEDHELPLTLEITRAENKEK